MLRLPSGLLRRRASCSTSRRGNRCCACAFAKKVLPVPPWPSRAMLSPAPIAAAASSKLGSCHGPACAGSAPAAQTGWKQPTSMSVLLSASSYETLKRLPEGQQLHDRPVHAQLPGAPMTQTSLGPKAPFPACARWQGRVRQPSLCSCSLEARRSREAPRRPSKSSIESYLTPLTGTLRPSSRS